MQTWVERGCRNQVHKGDGSSNIWLFWRLIVGLLIGLSMMATARPTMGAENVRKSIAVVVEGPNAALIREEILAIVPAALQVVDPHAFYEALQDVGQTKPFEAALGQVSERGKVIEALRSAARDVHADAVVVGIIRSVGTKNRLYLLWIDDVAGASPVDDTMVLESSLDARQQALKEALSSTLQEIAVGERKPRAIKPLPPIKDLNKGKRGRVPYVMGQELVVVGMGFGLGGRRFAYSDGLTTNLRPYDVFGAPMPTIFGEVYPFAGMNIAVLKDVGITGGYARAIGLESATSNDTLLDTTYQRLDIGLRLRFRTGDSSRPVLGISGGFRTIEFSFDATGDLVTQIPQVGYSLLRVGVDGRLPLGPVALMAGFDYLGALDTGDVYERFRGVSIGGIGPWMGLVVPVMKGAEIRVVGRYDRFFSAFSPEVGDAYVAGGALDEFVEIGLTGAFVY